MKNITAMGSLFVVGETHFRLVETIFFLHFSETPVKFFPSFRKVFFNEILHSGWWKRISWLAFAQSFSSKWRPSLKLMEANFYLILTNENWFLGLWKPFSFIFLDSSQLLPVEAVFHLNILETWKRGIYPFCLLFYSKFFSVSGNYYWN